MSTEPSPARRADSFTTLREIGRVRRELGALRELDARPMEDQLVYQPAAVAELRRDLAREIADGERTLHDLLVTRDLERADTRLASRLRHAGDGAAVGVGAIVGQLRGGRGLFRIGVLLLLPLLAVPRLGPGAWFGYAALPVALLLAAAAGAVAGVLTFQWGDAMRGRMAIGIAAAVVPCAACNLLALWVKPETLSLPLGPFLALTAAEAVILGAAAGATWPWLDAP